MVLYNKIECHYISLSLIARYYCKTFFKTLNNKIKRRLFKEALCQLSAKKRDMFSTLSALQCRYLIDTITDVCFIRHGNAWQNVCWQTRVG